LSSGLLIQVQTKTQMLNWRSVGARRKLSAFASAAVPPSGWRDERRFNRAKSPCRGSSILRPRASTRAPARELAWIPSRPGI